MHPQRGRHLSHPSLELELVEPVEGVTHEGFAVELANGPELGGEGADGLAMDGVFEGGVGHAPFIAQVS